MKKFAVWVVVVLCIVCIAGCKDKDAEAAEAKALEMVQKYYDIFTQGLEDLYDFSLVEYSTPTINKVEKVGDGRYTVTGSVTGIAMKNGISKSWIASWKLTIVRDDSGEFKVATSPKPDYGTIQYLN